MKNEHGFTLLELLMVVIIIAILAAVALPQYIKATEKARASEGLQMLGAIRSAEQRFKSTSDAVPPTFTANPDDLDTMDAANPVQTKYWGQVPAAVTLTAASASLTRVGGPYNNQVLGLEHDGGVVCGNFAKSTGINALAGVCP